MKHLYFFLILQFICRPFFLLGETSILNGATCNKDGRSLALGGGVNANEKYEVSGLSISYLIPYNLIELSTRSIAGTLKTEWVRLNGRWSQTGNGIFMENYIHIGASKYLSKDFNIGVECGYYDYAAINGTDGSTLLSEISCSYKPFEDMNVCIYLFNPTGSKVRKLDDAIPLNQSFHFGGSYFPIRNTELLFEFEKRLKQRPILHVGCESVIWNAFEIRAGLSAKPLMPSCGIGGKIQRLKYSIGWNMHPTLGSSSCFSLQYNWE